MIGRATSRRLWWGLSAVAALGIVFASFYRGTPPSAHVGAAAASAPKVLGVVGTGPAHYGPDIPAHRTSVARLPKREGPLEDPGLVALGRAIFSDERLSDPEGTSCATCHDPKRAFSGDNGSGIGVPRGSRPGHFARRSTPSVLYLKYVPRFHFHEDDEAAAPSPIGGFFWDGRSDGIAELVKQPLFNPDEMNSSTTRAAVKVASGPYAAEFRAAFGSNTNAVVENLGKALQAYLTSDEMAPATSKYDAYVRGQATLTPLEKRGIEAFKDPTRGACAGCHQMNETSTNPKWSMFTDYGFDAVGVPRNRKLPENSARPFDLGLCERKDTTTPTNDDKWCGNFRTPSLRNVAVRRNFMHNGEFTSLRDVIRFYATRATSPAKWYPAGTKFDDLPEKYKENVNIYSPPYNRREGAAPPLSDDDIDAIVAFLGTLTDAAYAEAGASP